MTHIGSELRNKSAAGVLHGIFGCCKHPWNWYDVAVARRIEEIIPSFLRTPPFD
ncbi:MAG: hypothetical protein KA247_02485 [Bacteroidetes bacterium]|nr:hypothetical protein [Bacteroidota bacterium]